MKRKTNSSQEMISLGKEISSTLTGGDIVLLYGELGAGKTTLTKGIALELGVKDEIVSPTFTLMQEYRIEDPKLKIKRLVHVDTYRLEDEQQLVEIGIEDYLGDKETVCVIEWPEKIEALLRDKKIKHVTIEHSGDGRLIKIED